MRGIQAVLHSGRDRHTESYQDQNDLVVEGCLPELKTAHDGAGIAPPIAWPPAPESMLMSPPNRVIVPL